jgi:hypothetical protein
MKPVSRVVFLAAALVVLVTAGGRCPAGELHGSEMFRSDDRFSESIDMLFDVEQGGELSLGTTNGSVRVRTWSRDQIRLVVTKSTTASGPYNARTILEDFLVQARHQGKNLRLTGKADSENCRKSVGVTFTVWVPRNFNVAIDTGDGDVELGKLNGSFSARTARGRISFQCEPSGMDIEVENNTG